MKPISNQFFNHYSQPTSLSISKLNSLHDVLRGQLHPSKSGPISLWLTPHMMKLKSTHNLYAPPSPINMITMGRQHTTFLLASSSPQGILFTRLFTAPWQEASPISKRAMIRHHKLFPSGNSVVHTNLFTGLLTVLLPNLDMIVEQAH